STPAYLADPPLPGPIRRVRPHVGRIDALQRCAITRARVGPLGQALATCAPAVADAEASATCRSAATLRTEEGALDTRLHNSSPTFRSATHDEAPSRQVQDRSSPRPEHLGPAEEPPQQARVAPRPAWR